MAEALGNFNYFFNNLNLFIRGIIQLTLLAELEERTGSKCIEIFDFFAGTSIVFHFSIKLIIILINLLREV
jgi:patatin-like phospholipase/acyl hydrolase